MSSRVRIVALLSLIAVGFGVCFCLLLPDPLLETVDSPADFVVPSSRVSADEPEICSAGANRSSRGNEGCRDPVLLFDSLTDKWTHSDCGRAQVEDMDAFVRAVRQLPRELRAECVQRALNLIPDEHADLLIGVLMDKDTAPNLAMMIFHDLLNRTEAVKRRMFDKIISSAEHPCLGEAKWILKVTGESAGESRGAP